VAGSSTIATLAINITARTKGLQKGLTRGRKALSKFAKGVPLLNTNISKIAVAATAAAAGLAVLIRREMNLIDATAKLADELGATTEGIQALAFAAELSGVEGAIMTKSFQFLAKNLGEAKSGVGEAKQALDLLGLSAAALVKLRPEDAFALLSDELNKLTDQSTRAFVAQKLFGRAGGKLLNLLRLGSKGIRELRIEAEGLGLTFSRIDAATVEEAVDAITRFKGVFRGISIELTKQVSPVITFVAEALKDFTQRGGDVGDIVVKTIRRIVGAAGTIIDVFSLIKAGIVTLKAAVLTGIQTGLWPLTKNIEILVAGVNKVRKLVGKAPIANIVTTLNETLKEEFKAAPALAAKYFDAFDTGQGKARVLTAFDDIHAKAKARAIEVIDLAKKAQAAAAAAGLAAGKQDGAKAVARKDRTAQFREINIARTALGGPQQLNKPQKVEDPQLALTNKTLINIWRGLGQAFSAPQEVGP